MNKKKVHITIKNRQNEREREGQMVSIDGRNTPKRVKGKKKNEGKDDGSVKYYLRKPVPSQKKGGGNSTWKHLGPKAKRGQVKKNIRGKK